MKKTTTTLEITNETYAMLQQIKTIFVSYTGEDIESFTDDKIIEVLASGFLGSEDDGAEGCGDGCGCHGHDEELPATDKKDGHECKGHCHH